MNGWGLLWIFHHLCVWSNAEKRPSRPVFRVDLLPNPTIIINHANDYLPMLKRDDEYHYIFDTDDSETEYSLDDVSGSFLFLSEATRFERSFILRLFQWSIGIESCRGLQVYFQSPDGNIHREDVPGFTLRVSELNQDDETFDIEQEMNPNDLPQHFVGTKGLLYIPSHCNLTVDFIILRQAQAMDYNLQPETISFLN